MSGSNMGNGRGKGTSQVLDSCQGHSQPFPILTAAQRVGVSGSQPKGLAWIKGIVCLLLISFPYSYSLILYCLQIISSANLYEALAEMPQC